MSFYCFMKIIERSKTLKCLRALNSETEKRSLVFDDYSLSCYYMFFKSTSQEDIYAILHFVTNLDKALILVTTSRYLVIPQVIPTIRNIPLN